MIISGHVKGENCKYRNFVYKIPIQTPVSWLKTENEMSIQDRYLNVLAGIDSKQVTEQMLKTEEIVAYEFLIDEHNEKFAFRKVQLFLCWNKYTMARKDTMVGEWHLYGPEYDGIISNRVLSKLLLMANLFY
jgi:hypothetical protein